METTLFIIQLLRHKCHLEYQHLFLPPSLMLLILFASSPLQVVANQHKFLCFFFLFKCGIIVNYLRHIDGIQALAIGILLMICVIVRLWHYYCFVSCLRDFDSLPAENQPHLSTDIIKIMEQRLSVIEQRNALLQNLINKVINC